MNAGLAKLRAEESTALYDAVVYSLYNFLGVKGQRALVLVTDGKDTSSKFSFDQAIEYARRAAVPIYAIGIGIRMSEVDTRYKLSTLLQRDRRQRLLHRAGLGSRPHLHRHPERAPLPIHPRLLPARRRQARHEVACSRCAGERRQGEDDSRVLPVAVVVLGDTASAKHQLLVDVRKQVGAHDSPKARYSRVL